MYRPVFKALWLFIACQEKSIEKTTLFYRIFIALYVSVAFLYNKMPVKIKQVKVSLK